jgi:WD40 repeat protein
VFSEGKGTPIKSLDSMHHGWVKGLAFDPIGRYLASQGRNGVKVWDMERDWALVTHERKAFERAPDAGFRFRWVLRGQLDMISACA